MTVSMNKNHIISYIEHTKLKLSNFVVKLLSTEPVTALFDTGATCSYIPQQVFMKIFDKANITKKHLKMNTAHGATLEPMWIAPLELNIDDQHFVYNFVVCMKLKQHLIYQLDFTQRYRIGIVWDMYGKLFFRCDSKK